MKNKKTNYLIIGTVALLGLIILSLGSYYFIGKQNQPSSSPVTIATDTIDNWKTYENKKFAFRFKFPETWDVEERGEEILMFPVGEKHDYTIGGNTIMFVYLSEDDQRQLDYLKSEYYKEAVELQIGGKNALKDSNNLFAIIKVSDDISIEIRGGDNPKNKKESIKYFDQILSTFKFK